MRVSVVVGNPRFDSRTLRVAQFLADEVAQSVDGPVFSVDLACHAGKIFEWPNDELTVVTQKVAASQCVIFASPTYKGSYTGLLKAFLDRYPNNGLCGVVAVPLMTASSPMHAMAVELTLRPLLVELGARVPTKGICFQMSQLDEMVPIIQAWLSENGPVLAACMGR